MLSFQTLIKIIILSCFFTIGLYFLDFVLLREHPGDEEMQIDTTYFSLPDGDESQNIALPLPLVPTSEAYSSGSIISSSTDTGSVDSTEEDTLSLGLPSQTQKKLHFTYIPQTFQTDASLYTQISREFLAVESIQVKIKTLKIEFYKKLVDVRGKMKHETIKMWGLQKLSSGEFLSVFIHEFSHYLDIYYFSQGVLGDISTKFYGISWQEATVLKKGQKPTDFVSGYASINQYEDFAESFTYFLLHNSDFLIKTESSSILREKYDFFGDILFFTGEFSGTDFSSESKIEPYYWDITKIPIEVENFLQYIKNEI